MSYHDPDKKSDCLAYESLPMPPIHSINYSCLSSLTQFRSDEPFYLADLELLKSKRPKILNVCFGYTIEKRHCLDKQKITSIII